jgi:hypothetical protein
LVISSAPSAETSATAATIGTKKRLRARARMGVRIGFDGSSAMTSAAGAVVIDPDRDEERFDPLGAAPVSSVGATGVLVPDADSGTG